MARLLSRLAKRRPEPPPAALLSGGQDTQWQAAFRDASLLAEELRTLGEAGRRMSGHLGWAYAAQERLGRRYLELLVGLADALDYCEGLEPAPPAVEALGARLAGLLAGHGVQAWSPPLGEPTPEGCEVVGIVPAAGRAPGAVERVVRCGYRLGDAVLRRPQLVVCSPEFPAPAGAGAEPGERP